MVECDYPGMPLRFCMVTTFYPPYHFGGDAIFVRDLSRALVAQGHSVDVVHCEDAYRLRGSSPQRDGGDGDGITVHRLHSRFGALSPLITQQIGQPGFKHSALMRIFEKQFDVIHFHNISLVGGPGILAMGNAPVKLYTTHEHWLVCPTHVLWKNREKACDKPQCFRCSLISGIPPQLWRYTGLIERSLKHVDALLSPSEFTAQRHRDGGITSPIHVLPTFTKIEMMPANVVAKNSRPNFVYVGRLTTSKGVLDIAELFSRLPQYDLTIAGGGELLDSMKSRFGECKNIHLLGSVTRQYVMQLYQEATALILPCIGPEVFPLVVLEAMSCGTPAIVRQAGGSGEAVRACNCGVVYQTADELENAVHRMATDGEWRQTLGRNAREGFEQHYTQEVHLKRYFDIIQTIQQAKRL